ncbi:LysE family translocator [Streptomyces benahoarensis]|uniref:LysE family translocator n=1 Tax=Streptomyces benahoarensis TaxID=2595054 RepID=A0A553ZL44_9ACTN|nr:LysE family translocator [Streptomyces benahoarensis]TSB18170.1 LysE family translocator [Streptomyces benahoarensis]TSB42189.1 LysE family translocator [Streptomyces benahoarensis]
MFTSLLGFTAVAALLTVSPGPDFAVVLRTALGSGRRAALCSAFGIAAGCFVWGLAGAVGLTAMLSASEAAYGALRVAGALYLMWLGVQALRASRRNRTAPETAIPATDEDAGTDGLSPLRAFRTGLLTNVLNPKVGVVYLSLLPQFIPHGAPVVATTLLLVAVHAALGVLWLGTLACAVHRARAFFHRPRVGRRLDQAAGGVLLALGAATGFEAAR